MYLQQNGPSETFSLTPIGCVRNNLERHRAFRCLLQDQSRTNCAGAKAFKILRHDLQPRIDRFTFESQHPKDTLMHPPQWFSSDEPFQTLDAEGKLTQGQRSLG